MVSDAHRRRRRRADQHCKVETRIHDCDWIRLTCVVTSHLIEYIWKRSTAARLRKDRFSSLSIALSISNLMTREKTTEILKEKYSAKIRIYWKRVTMRSLTFKGRKKENDINGSFQEAGRMNYWRKPNLSVSNTHDQLWIAIFNWVRENWQN